MSPRAIFNKSAKVACAIAGLAIAIPALPSTPAAAASTALAYTCAGTWGSSAITYTQVLDATSVEYGGSVPIATTYHIMSGAQLFGAGATRIDGTIDNHVTLASGTTSSAVKVPETIASITLDGTAVLNATATGKVSLAGFPAGSTVAASAGVATGTDLYETRSIYTKDSSGTESLMVGIPEDCTLDANQTATLGQVTVVKATTTPKLSVSKPGKHKLTAKVTLTAPNSSAIATGKVKVSAHRSGKTITKTAKLTNGKVTVKFSKLKKAKYTVTVKYLGTTNFAASTIVKSKKV